jgi:2,3-dihydroxybenzoate decarboxylase
LTSTSQAPLTTGGEIGYLRIATEEAFAPPEMLDAFRRKLATDTTDTGFISLMGHYLTSQAERPRFVRAGLQDAGELRLGHMDAAGIDHAILALTSPGTQALGAGEAREIAAIANDRLAAACRAHPSRFSALAAVGFEDAPSAVAELDRAVGTLGLKGLICNSHINGAYLDEPRFYPILEAVEALGVPLYLHPNTPSNRMIAPMVEAGIDGAIYGFAVETSMHLLRIITAGVLDRFPALKIVVGHLGEALPYWFYRLDYMHAGQVASNRYEAIKPLQLTPSEYFHRNIWLTTSGMPWAPTIMYAREVMGPDRVMYAMDYPYEYVPDEVRMQDALPLTITEKKQFFQDIAVDVFGLDLAAITA